MFYYIDGGCSGNSQKDLDLRDMVSVVADDDGNILVDYHEHGGSNNIAELIALVEVMRLAIEQNDIFITVITDSKNTTYWFKSCRVKKSNDRRRVESLLEEIKELKKRVMVELIWHPREVNYAGWYIEELYCL